MLLQLAIVICPQSLYANTVIITIVYYIKIVYLLSNPVSHDCNTERSKMIMVRIILRNILILLIIEPWSVHGTGNLVYTRYCYINYNV